MKSKLFAVVVCVLFIWLAQIIIKSYFNPPIKFRPNVFAEIYSISRALETYFLDHHAYPAWSVKPDENAFGGLPDSKGKLASRPTFRMRHGSALATVTTPVAYLEAEFNEIAGHTGYVPNGNGYYLDPFAPVKGATFCYWTNNAITTASVGYILWSPGPDRNYDLTLSNIAKAYDPGTTVPSNMLLDLTYDPSNGTGSSGDLYRVKI